MLRARPHERSRMTRGRCGSLLLHRVTLSFTTPRRFNPAHGGQDMGRSKTVARRMLLSLLLVAWPLASTGWAQVSFPSRPPTGGVISDEIGLITVEHRQEIDQLGAALFKEKGYPVTVATIRSLAAQKATGYTIERYASELIKAWNLGPDHLSHGMLLLVAEDD